MLAILDKFQGRTQSEKVVLIFGTIKRKKCRTIETVSVPVCASRFEPFQYCSIVTVQYLARNVIDASRTVSDVFSNEIWFHFVYVQQT